MGKMKNLEDELRLVQSQIEDGKWYRAGEKLPNDHLPEDEKDDCHIPVAFILDKVKHHSIEMGYFTAHTGASTLDKPEFKTYSQRRTQYFEPNEVEAWCKIPQVPEWVVNE